MTVVAHTCRNCFGPAERTRDGIDEEDECLRQHFAWALAPRPLTPALFVPAWQPSAPTYQAGGSLARAAAKHCPERASPGPAGPLYGQALRALSLSRVGDRRRTPPRPLHTRRWRLAAGCFARQSRCGTLLQWARDHTDRLIMGETLPASSFAALPALFVLLQGPVVLTLVRRLRATRYRHSDFAQLRIGLLSVALACIVLLVASLRLPSVPQQSPLWLLACFALLVLGELLIAPLGLALTARVVAPQHVGLVNALWYAVMVAGFVLAGEFGSLLQHTPQWVCFALQAGVATAAAVGMRGRDLASSSG